MLNDSSSINVDDYNDMSFQPYWANLYSFCSSSLNSILNSQVSQNLSFRCSYLIITLKGLPLKLGEEHLTMNQGADTYQRTQRVSSTVAGTKRAETFPQPVKRLRFVSLTGSLFTDSGSLLFCGVRNAVWLDWGFLGAGSLCIRNP